MGHLNRFLISIHEKWHRIYFSLIQKNYMGYSTLKNEIENVYIYELQDYMMHFN